MEEASSGIMVRYCREGIMCEVSRVRYHRDGIIEETSFRYHGGRMMHAVLGRGINVVDEVSWERYHGGGFKEVEPDRDLWIGIHDF